MTTARRYGGVAVLILSVAYYALYVNCGFTYTDDGNYAQICYELFLGRPFQDMDVNYGLFWFKIGEGLFHLFGVNFILVRWLFFACIALTNVLLFTTLLKVMRDWRPAVALTLVPLLVPPFPATAFYGLCVMMNVAAQIRLSFVLHEPHTDIRREAVLAGAVLALSAQIRPDFAYVFAISLVGILILARRSDVSLRAAVIGATAGFVAVIAVFVLWASWGGYASVLVGQYLAYPRNMLVYGAKGVAALFAQEHGATAPGGLARPPMRWIWRGTRDQSHVALLVYLPLLGLIALGIAVASSTAHWWRRDRARLSQIVVAFIAALATFPHYFLFRPDVPHVANFMPGYVATAGISLALLWRDAAGIRIRSYAATAATFVVAVGLFTYLRLGLQMPVTSVATADGRTEHFQSANGVNVRVTPAEDELLTQVRDAITQNSRAGDAIVCLPYCPGFAFMTGRRMLLRSFYADDRYLTENPDWLPAAIAQTQRDRPPVVIISDWAINDTDESRFTHWAVPYVQAVRDLATNTVSVPGFTIYVLNSAHNR